MSSETFEPKEKVERQVTLNEPYKKTSKSINTNTLVLLFGFVLILFLFSIVGNTDKDSDVAVTDDESEKYQIHSEVTQDLPSDYEEWLRKNNKISDNNVAIAIPEVRALTEEEKILRELELEDLRARFDALDGELIVIRKEQRRGEATSISNIPQSTSTSISVDSDVATTGLSQGRDGFNRQDDKNQYISEKRDSESELHTRIQKPLSKNVLQGGSIIPGLLIQGINSDLPKYVSGVVSQNVFDSISGRVRLIPQGTKVLGEYDSRITFGQERILVVWTRLVFPNGTSINLEGMPGVDMSGYAGLSGEVNNHYGKLLAGVVLGSVIGAGAQIAEGSTDRLNESFEQEALRGASRNINTAGQAFVQKVLALQPTITKEPGEPFNVFVTKDIYLPPYEGE